MGTLEGICLVNIDLAPKAERDRFLLRGLSVLLLSILTSLVWGIFGRTHIWDIGLAVE